MFLQSPFEKTLDIAVSNSFGEPDYAINTKLCDMVRQGETKPAIALKAISKKFVHKDVNKTLLALTVLEMLVSNCGTLFAKEFCSAKNVEMYKSWLLLYEGSNDLVVARILTLLQNTLAGFSGEPFLSPLSELRDCLLSFGYAFPRSTVKEGSYKVTEPPPWEDSAFCTNCNSSFSAFNRKHHCRKCGRSFCQLCSSKRCPVLAIGLENPVRVCDSCYNQLTDKQTPLDTSSVHRPSLEEDDHNDEQLALAIAESLKLHELEQTRHSHVSPADTEKEKPNEIPTAYQAAAEASSSQTAGSSRAREPNDVFELFVTRAKPTLQLYMKKLQDAHRSHRNVVLDKTIQSLHKSTIALQSQLLDLMESTEYEKLKLLEVSQKIETIVKVRKSILELKRQQKEEQELLQRIQLEQKLRLIQQQEQALAQYNQQQCYASPSHTVSGPNPYFSQPCTTSSLPFYQYSHSTMPNPRAQYYGEQVIQPPPPTPVNQDEEKKDSKGASSSIDELISF
ncbi:hepatocyte growth factor-regulated tyrosine kinase substrate-like [Zophobas morio]|uniref:hepatocyte growth factor-regulated tyrosine kinase substrate-like n=1 Tax=Zophobas morio TaxID=2755281 RepID=UPI0030835F71